MGIFKLDNGNLTLSRVEIAGIPEFNEVLRSDRGSEGDADGRKKYKAFAEFMYIFLMYDHESPHAKLPDNLRKDRSIRDAKLPVGWKPDKNLKAAIKVYNDIQNNQSPSTKILLSLERGLNLSSRIVDTLIGRMEKTLNTIEKAMDAPPIDGIPAQFPDITPIISDLGTLMTISKGIPESIKSIEAIREKVMKEKGQADIIRGGREKANRENPKYINEKFKEEETTDDNRN